MPSKLMNPQPPEGFEFEGIVHVCAGEDCAVFRKEKGEQKNLSMQANGAGDLVKVRNIRCEQQREVRKKLPVVQFADFVVSPIVTAAVRRPEG